MPIKLIGAVILAVFVAVFTGFNLTNKCDVWLFHTFKDVPVAATIIGSFVVGVLVTLPFTFAKKKNRKDKDAKTSKKDDKNPASSMPQIHTSSETDSISVPAAPANAVEDTREEAQDDPV